MARTRSSRTAVPFRASHFGRAYRPPRWPGLRTVTALALVRPDGCYAYAIPVCKLEGTFKLPNIELTSSELDSYISIANSITPTPAEYTVQCPHPAKDAVKSNRGEWRGEESNSEALGQLLQQHADWLFPVITAALDVQLRSFAPCAEVPIFLYNFTVKSRICK